MRDYFKQIVLKDILNKRSKNSVTECRYTQVWTRGWNPDNLFGRLILAGEGNMMIDSDRRGEGWTGGEKRNCFRLDQVFFWGKVEGGN